MRIDSGFTLTETEQRQLKSEEYDLVNLNTEIRRSTQVSKSGSRIY